MTLDELADELIELCWNGEINSPQADAVRRQIEQLIERTQTS